MSKKSFTTSTESLLNRGTKPQEEVRQEAVPETPQKSSRPRTNIRRTSTSQEGLREGLTRMTFIVSQVKQDKLKYISYFERLSLRQILDEAIEDYINKYEAQVGPIELN